MTVGSSTQIHVYYVPRGRYKVYTTRARIKGNPSHAAAVTSFIRAADPNEPNFIRNPYEHCCKGLIAEAQG